MILHNCFLTTAEEEERFGSLDILYQVGFQCLSVVLLSKS